MASGFNLSFYVFCVVLGILAVRGILDVRKIFSYPTLAAFMGLAWVVPQGIELQLSGENIYASEGFWLYLTVCFLFIAAGFRMGYLYTRKRLSKRDTDQQKLFNQDRLIVCAAALTALGQFSTFQMGSIDTSQMGGQWTGVITLWALLGKSSGFGLCLAVLIFARTGSRVALVIAVIASVSLVQSAFLGVRREAIFDLVILTVAAWMIAKRKYPPRAAVVAAVLVGTVLLNSIGDIRGRVQTTGESFFVVMTSWDTYSEFDYTALGQGVNSEVGLAQYDFWVANDSWQWEYGKEHWNGLVHQYVPAFLVGNDFKEGLKLSTLSRRISTGEETGAFSLGRTRTGFSDSYRAIGPFGSLIFYLIAFFFGGVFARSHMAQIDGQYIYLVLLAEGLKAITHSTAELLAALPFTLVIYWFVFAFSRVRDGVATPDKRSVRHSADAAVEMAHR